MVTEKNFSDENGEVSFFFITKSFFSFFPVILQNDFGVVVTGRYVQD